MSFKEAFESARIGVNKTVLVFFNIFVLTLFALCLAVGIELIFFYDSDRASLLKSMSSVIHSWNNKQRVIAEDGLPQATLSGGCSRSSPYSNLPFSFFPSNVLQISTDQQIDLPYQVGVNTEFTPLYMSTSIIFSPMSYNDIISTSSEYQLVIDFQVASLPVINVNVHYAHVVDYEGSEQCEADGGINGEGYCTFHYFLTKLCHMDDLHYSPITPSMFGCYEDVILPCKSTKCYTSMNMGSRSLMLYQLMDLEFGEEVKVDIEVRSSDDPLVGLYNETDGKVDIDKYYPMGSTALGVGIGLFVLGIIGTALYAGLLSLRFSILCCMVCGIRKKDSVEKNTCLTVLFGFDALVVQAIGKVYLSIIGVLNCLFSGGKK